MKRAMHTTATQTIQRVFLISRGLILITSAKFTHMVTPKKTKPFSVLATAAAPINPHSSRGAW